MKQWIFKVLIKNKIENFKQKAQKLFVSPALQFVTLLLWLFSEEVERIYIGLSAKSAKEGKDILWLGGLNYTCFFLKTSLALTLLG